jgi:hypothetical protein
MHEAKTSRFGFAESRLRLISWSRTPDTLATLGMCPVVAVAPAPRVPLALPWLRAAQKRDDKIRDVR